MNALRMRGSGGLLLSCLVMLFFVSQLAAAPIGTLTTVACTGQGVTVTATLIDWLPAGGGEGCINTANPTNIMEGASTLLTSGVTGAIKDLPLGVSFPVVNFMTFTGSPVMYDLNSIGPGVANTVCPNVLDPSAPVCSVVSGSPFILTSGFGGTTVKLAAFGTVHDGVGTSSFIGTFSVDFAGETPSDVQNRFLTAGSITSGHSGSFVASAGRVPEPTTTALIGSALVALGVFSRRRKALKR